MPDGTLIQWGYLNSGDTPAHGSVNAQVAFPIGFAYNFGAASSERSVSVFPMLVGYTAAPGVDNWRVICLSNSLTDATLRFLNNTDSVANVNAKWLAIGRWK